MGGAGGGWWWRSGQTAAESMLQEARKEGEMLTVFTVAWGSSRCSRWSKGHTWLIGIAHRSLLGVGHALASWLARLQSTVGHETSGVRRGQVHWSQAYLWKDEGQSDGYKGSRRRR